jgi:hypothetical protein
LAFYLGTILRVSRLIAFKFLTDGCVQTRKKAVDFRRIVLDDDFSRDVSNRFEVEHCRLLSDKTVGYHLDRNVRNTAFALVRSILNSNGPDLECSPLSATSTQEFFQKAVTHPGDIRTKLNVLAVTIGGRHGNLILDWNITSTGDRVVPLIAEAESCVRRREPNQQPGSQRKSKRSLLLRILRYQRRRKSPFKTATISTGKYGSTRPIIESSIWEETGPQDDILRLDLNYRLDRPSSLSRFLRILSDSAIRLGDKPFQQD